MRFKVIACMLAVALLSAVAYGGDDNEKKREKSRKMAAQTLQDLYKREATAQTAVQKSAGYAVFNNMGTNLLLLSTARGSGIAVNTQSKQETFMKMISAGAGLGVGVKDYRVIFVFENDKALAQFLDSGRSEEHTSELQSRFDLVCRLLLEKKKTRSDNQFNMNATHDLVFTPLL